MYYNVLFEAQQVRATKAKRNTELSLELCGVAFGLRKGHLLKSIQK